MLDLNLIIIILIAHWVADFVSQSDKMALNKSKSNQWLTIHVLTYIVVVAVIVTGVLLYQDQFTLLIIPVLLKWLLLNFVLHWITDYITSRINSYLWQKEQRHWFFVMIGFDQLVHYICLFTTASFLTL